MRNATIGGLSCRASPTDPVPGVEPVVGAAGRRGHALTTLRASTYHFSMEDKTTALFEVELRRLEGRLDELVDVCRQLKEENQSLKQRQDLLMTERASLLQKNEQVRARVEAMIGRLKAMEHGG